MNLFWNKLELKYIELFDKYKTSKNQLLAAIIYSINLLKQSEKEYIEEICPFYFKNIENDQNKQYFLISLILQILSIKIIYSLPHMIYEPTSNNCLSTHVIYGESVSQLVAFCLLTESGNIINNIVRERPELLYELDSSMIDINEKILCVDKLSHEQMKARLKDDYRIKMKELFTRHRKYYELFYGIE